MKKRIAFFVLLFVVMPASALESLRQMVENVATQENPSIMGEQLHNAHSLLQYYELREFKPLWVDDGQFKPFAEEFNKLISQLGKHGLQPSDYHGELLITGFTVASQSASLNYELLFTDAFIELTHHLVAGKVKPSEVSKEWLAPEKPVDFIAALAELERLGDPFEVVKKLQPQQVRYERLQNTLLSLIKLNELEKDYLWQPLSLSPILKKGVSDARIPDIRKRLSIWKDYSGDDLQSTLYDEGLEVAVKAFQARHGLQEDGILGAESLRALNHSILDRIQTVTVNLERWRWLESEFGNEFIVVNIAGFDLRLYSNNELVHQVPVIVGRNYRKSPVFSDLIRYIVFNPTWTVPHKIAVQDKLPEIKKSPQYLDQLGFKVYSLGGGSAIDPALIPWQELGPSKFPYRLVQAPGPANALGQVKFMFPNQFDVYLHDTPVRELFAKSERAFSSGCIRVSKPLDLANKLLQKQGWTASDTAALIDSQETKTVYLKNPMPIHIEYWTVWVDKKGVMHFRDDIYKRDKPLWNALNN